MKLLFVSSYHYPGRPAQFKHGLIMARQYARILKKDFLYAVLSRSAGQLPAIPHITFSKFPLRRFRLISIFLFFYLGIFFVTHPTWRGSQVVTVTQESKIAALLLFWKAFFKFSVIYECHGLHSSRTDKFVCSKSDAVVFVTKKTLEEAQKKFNTKYAVLLPNAVDTTDFDYALKLETVKLRAELGIPQDKKIIGYVGRFRAIGFDKGIENMLHALTYIIDNNVTMCFVGGTKEEIIYYTKFAEKLGVHNRVCFFGYQKENREIAKFTVAMDVLMYIPPPEKFFTEETSPMKLYEYMASQRPIITSDFPAMHEILTKQSAVFVDPLDSQKVASVIESLVHDSVYAQELADAAHTCVLGNTWLKRGEDLVSVAHKFTQ